MGGVAMALADEKALVAQAVSEPGAFAPIYDHYFAPVYRYVRYRVQDANMADDLTSQVFEQALRHIRSYQPERGEFAVWLFTIARNAVRDHFRALRRRRLLPFDLVEAQASQEPQPEVVRERSEAWEQITRALEQLPDRERELVALKFGAMLSKREIATVTGLSESNVSVILYRTRTRVGKQAVGPGD